jgi:excinuclease UvrABC nuclease subunit
VTVPAPISLDPRAANLRADIDALPAAAGIYLLRSEHGSPHLAWSSNLRRRMSRLLFAAQSDAGTPFARLRESVTEVECWVTTSRLESALLMHSLARQYHPNDYLFRLKLRIPWFVGLTLADRFPRLTVVNRVPRRETMLLGPFPSRAAAQIYEQQVAGLFQIRRCTEVLKPSPDHPGCVYGEMGQCLRPCQCAVTKEEYATETQRVSDFLKTNGRAALAVMTTARDRAAEQTDFEQAAHIHKQVEKIRAAATARDEVVANVYHLNGVALTRGAGVREFRFWPMVAGYWQDCIQLQIPTDVQQSKSLDETVRELLTERLRKPAREGRRAEDLAIFARWYYASWRDGQWFPFREIEDLNYRKLVKEISSLAKSECPQPAISS